MKISELPSVTSPLNRNIIIPMVQSGSTVQGVLSSVEYFIAPDDLIVSTSSRSLGFVDINKVLKMTNPGGCDLYIPSASEVDFPIKTTIFCRRTTLAGIITISTHIDVVLNDNQSTIILPGSQFAIRKVATNEWDFI
jgi:hypothetical protein